MNFQTLTKYSGKELTLFIKLRHYKQLEIKSPEYLKNN